MGFVHQVANMDWILGIPGADARFFRYDEAITTSRGEVPGMVVSVLSLSLIGAERDPADALIRNIVSNPGLDGAVENLQTVERTQTSIAGRFIGYVLDQNEPVRPVDRVGETRECTMAASMNQQFVVAEHRGYSRVVSGGPANRNVAVRSVRSQFILLSVQAR